VSRPENKMLLEVFSIGDIHCIIDTGSIFGTGSTIVMFRSILLGTTCVQLVGLVGMGGYASNHQRSELWRGKGISL